jgi:hypothetical protein
MLPDITPLKKDIAETLRTVLKQRVRYHMGAFNESPRHYIKEGNRIVTVRPDGTTDETKLKSSEAEIIMSHDDVRDLNFQMRSEKLDAAAHEMAAQMSEHLFNILGEAVERVGNKVDGKGKPLGPEAFLEMLDKLQLEFKDDGTHENLSIIIPPNLMEKAHVTAEQLQNDPAYRKRYEEIITNKRREWRAREAARKLVG